MKKHTIMEQNNLERRCGSNCNKPNGFPIVGVFLIGMGLVFLLDRLNVIPNQWRHIIISWQALLIFIGFINIFKNHARLPGVILVLVGSAFLVPEIVHIPFETRQLIWPLILIIVGLAIVFKTRNLKSPHVFNPSHDAITSTEKIDEVAIFGGGKRVITTQNLKGGNVTAIFGGLEIDLSDAEIEGESVVLEVAAIFGGVTVIVKPEWDVQVQVASVFGGFTDKRKMYKNQVQDERKQLILKGAAIFGGGEVKSF